MFKKKIDQRVWRYLDHWHHLRSINGQTVELKINELKNSDDLILAFSLYQPATTYGGETTELTENISLKANHWTWIHINNEFSKKISLVRSQIKVQRK